jgi:Secretion system C-terminal sorting domain
MKKVYVLALLLGAFAHLQAQSFTQNWKKLANATDYAWFTNDNNVTSLAYNPITDKLLVAKRADRIFVINPATGAQEDTLSTKGAAIGTEGLKYNKIRVAADGSIYAISLQTAAGTARIYRWASQADTATLCATFAVTERVGDAFGLSGTGATTVLYASGAGATANAFSIYILSTTDGKAFTLESTVTMTSAPTTNQQWANRTVEPEGTGVNAPIWIKGGGFTARKITISAKNAANIRTGTVVATVPDGTTAGEASIGYGGMRMLTTANSTKFLVFGGGNNQYAGTKMTAITVARDTVFNLFGRDSVTAQTAYVTNTNGTGDVSFKVNANGTFTAYYLSTNNAIAAATSRVFTPTKDLNTVKTFEVQTLGNPINDALNLQINAVKEGKIAINVVNSMGSLVSAKQMAVNAGANTVNLPMAQFPTGMYFVTVQDGTSLQTIKVVKQ